MSNGETCEIIGGVELCLSTQPYFAGLVHMMRIFGNIREYIKEHKYTSYLHTEPGQHTKNVISLAYTEYRKPRQLFLQGKVGNYIIICAHKDRCNTWFSI